MLDASHPYLTSHWMASLLTFQDLRSVALVCTALASTATLAMREKVRRLSIENSFSERERECIQSIRDGSVRGYTPALYSLQLRFLRTSEYHMIIQRDPRLSKASKLRLHDEDLRSPSVLYYWFAFECLPYTPLRVHFSTSMCRKSLALPYGLTCLCDNVHMCNNKRGHIQFELRVNTAGVGGAEAEPHARVCGVLTERDELWPTALWNASIAVCFHEHCLLEPFPMVSAGRPHCPFCGLSIALPASHSMECMMRYACWSTDHRNDINRFDSTSVQKRMRTHESRYTINAASAASTHCVSTRSPANKRRFVRSHAC